MASALGFMRGLTQRGRLSSSSRVPFWRSLVKRRKRRSSGGRAPRRRMSLFPQRRVTSVGRRMPMGLGGALAFGRGGFGSMKSPAKVMAGKRSARTNPWVNYLKAAVERHYVPGSDYPAFVREVAMQYRRS
jgi:hypothetical protein